MEYLYTAHINLILKVKPGNPVVISTTNSFIDFYSVASDDIYTQIVLDESKRQLMLEMNETDNLVEVKEVGFGQSQITLSFNDTPEGSDFVVPKVKIPDDYETFENKSCSLSLNISSVSSLHHGSEKIDFKEKDLHIDSQVKHENFSNLNEKMKQTLKLPRKVKRENVGSVRKCNKRKKQKPHKIDDNIFVDGKYKVKKPAIETKNVSSKSSTNINGKSIQNDFQMSEVSELPLVCIMPRCDESFQTKKELLDHYKIHSSMNWKQSRKKDFQCPYCDDKFVSGRLLKIHLIRKHKNCSNVVEDMSKLDPSSLFLCDFCARIFTRKQELFRHIQAVHEIDSVKCPECNIICTNNLKLQLHMKRVHAPIEERTKQCNICGLVVSKKKLGVHIRTVHERSNVKYCDWPDCKQSFVSNYTLKNHTRRHTGDKPLKCQYCKFAAIQRSSMNYHMQKHHPDIWADIQMNKKPTQTS